MHVVNIKDLQRNIKNPQAEDRIAFAKRELTVISESLTDYIIVGTTQSLMLQCKGSLNIHIR